MKHPRPAVSNWLFIGAFCFLGACGQGSAPSAHPEGVLSSTPEGQVPEPAAAPASTPISGGDATAAGSRRSPVVQVIEQVSPAVVNISTEQLVKVNPFWRSRGPDPFDWFSREFGPREESFTRNSLGSGVIIDQEGHVLTNEHVILQGSRITVALADKREFEAELVGSDPKSDLAVLKINSRDALPMAPMGTSADLMIGETVVAIGNPFGLNHTVTTGVISAVGRTLQTEDRVYRDFIQTDASINPGNSGGPLLNIEGQLIGITTAIYGSGAQNIGFAIPIDRARRIVDDLIRQGAVEPAWVGLEVQDPPAREGERARGGRGGAVVAGVSEGSPAAAAGLRRGDLITALGSETVDSAAEFQESLRGYTAGDEISVAYQRDGAARRATMRGIQLPIGRVEDELWGRIGFQVIEITPALARRYDLPTPAGVAIRRVREGSPAYRIGLDGGDVLLRIDGTGIGSLDDLRRAVIPVLGRNSVSLMIQRGGQRYRGVLEF